MTAKEQLREVVERLSEDESVAALRAIETAAARDPLLDLLADAPPDDEPSSPEEDASAEEAWAAYRRGEGIALKQLRGEPG